MILRLSPLNRLGLCFVGVSAIALGIATSAGSCTQNNGNNGFGGSGGAGSSGPGSGGASPNLAKQLFASIDQDLYAACGQCHDIGGIADAPFLAGPDHYRSITSWPGIVVKNAAESKLETIPVSGPQHPYRKLDAPEFATTLYPKVKAWLDAEAKTLASADQPEAGKAIDAFSPILGFNAVYLDALGAEFTGMAVTFSADQLDDHTLKLDEIQVHPTSKLGIHIVHPLFVVYPAGSTEADPDPVDSFSNVDQTFQPNAAGALGPGTMILTNWLPDAKITIGFEKLEVVMPMMDDGGMPTGACKDVNSFNTNAAPLFKSNCQSCHGGSNAQAQGAVDMSALSSDPAAACAQIKNRVNPADPPSSQLFITTDPKGNAAHPYKFGGDVSKFGAFKTSVSTWIAAEK